MLAIAIDLGIRDGLQNLPFSKFIPQAADDFVFKRHVTAGQFGGLAQRDDVGDVLGAGALAVLLAAAHEVGIEAAPPVHVEHADALGQWSLWPETERKLM